MRVVDINNRATERCIRRDRVKGDDLGKALEKAGLTSYAKVAKETFAGAEEKAEKEREENKAQEKTDLSYICMGCKNKIQDCVCDYEEEKAS